MLRKKFIKISAGILILAQLGLSLPLFASAQAVPTCDPGSGVNCAAGYIAGIATNATFIGAVGGITGHNETCAKTEAAFEAGDSTAHVALSGLSVISGGSVLTAQLTAKIAKYNSFIVCREAVLAELDLLPAPNVFASNLKQQQVTNASNAVGVYKTKIEQAQARLDSARQGFWKTLVFNILIKTSKAVANTLMNKLVSNYKINNYKQYVDSTAALMYQNQFIRQNFPKDEDKMMARAILNNPQLRNQVQPAMFLAADTALGFQPNSLDPNDPDYYTKMARVGSAEANPFYQNTVYVNSLDQALANSQTTAQAQISQGNGYKTPVSCQGSIGEQQAIDSQTKAASDRLENRGNLLNDLQNAKNLGEPVNEKDIQKAQTDYDSASQAWKNLPTNLSTKNSRGGIDVSNSIAIKMCEGIVSPAKLVEEGINEAFKSISKNMSNFNDNNLPGFTSMIGDVASQIGSSLIFGGAQGAKNAIILNEGNLITGGVTQTLSTVSDNHADNLAKRAENLAKGVDFYDTEDSPGNYTLTWDVTGDLVGKASYVKLSGDGAKTYKYEIPQSIKIATTVGGLYTLQVYDKSDKLLTSATLTIMVNLSNTYVAGAYTTREILTRGPLPSLSVRGY